MTTRDPWLQISVPAPGSPGAVRALFGVVVEALGHPSAPWSCAEATRTDAELREATRVGDEVKHVGRYTRPAAELAEAVTSLGNPRDRYSHTIRWTLRCEGREVAHADGSLPVGPLLVRCRISPEGLEQIRGRLGINGTAADAFANATAVRDSHREIARRWVAEAPAIENTWFAEALAELAATLGDDAAETVVRAPWDLRAWEALAQSPPAGWSKDATRQSLAHLMPDLPMKGPPRSGDWRRWSDGGGMFPDRALAAAIAGVDTMGFRPQREGPRGAILSTWARGVQSGAVLSPVARWYLPGRATSWTWIWGPESDDLLLLAIRDRAETVDSSRWQAVAHRVQGQATFRAQVRAALREVCGGRWRPCTDGAILRKPARRVQPPLPRCGDCSREMTITDVTIERCGVTVPNPIDLRDERVVTLECLGCGAVRVIRHDA